MSNDEHVQEEQASEDTDASDKVLIAYAMWLTYIQRMCLNALYSIFPFYILSTPQHGWSATDFSLIFTVSNVGSIVGSQIMVMLSYMITNSDHLSKALFIGHLSQFIAAILAFFIICDAFVSYNYVLFVISAFLIGYVGDITLMQSYATYYNSAETLMQRIGQIIIMSLIIDQFLLPAIYDGLGFNALCIFIICVLVFSIFILIILRYKLKQRKDTGAENEVTLDIKVQNSSNSSLSLKNMSSTIYVLLLLVFIVNFCMEMYAVCAPIAFITEFHISA
eukprot:292176_1